MEVLNLILNLYPSMNRSRIHIGHAIDHEPIPILERILNLSSSSSILHNVLRGYASPYIHAFKT